MTAHQACDTLNEVLKIDPAALISLFHCRRSCSESLARHPHVLVGEHEGGRYSLGFLGLINGMLLAAGSAERVAVEVDDQNNQNVLRFVVIPNSEFKNGQSQAMNA